MRIGSFIIPLSRKKCSSERGSDWPEATQPGRRGAGLQSFQREQCRALLAVPRQDEARAFRTNETGPWALMASTCFPGAVWVLKLPLDHHLPSSRPCPGDLHAPQPWGSPCPASVPLSAPSGPAAPPWPSPALLRQASSSARSCTSSSSPATRNPTWLWTSITSCAA